MTWSSLGVLGPVRRCGVVVRSRVRCAWCGCDLVQQITQIDHVVPRVDGGASRLDNLVAACPACNGTRAEGLDAFRAHLTACGVRLCDAVRRVNAQLRRPIDRARAWDLAVKWYPWVVAYYERDRRLSLVRYHRAAARNRAAASDGLGGVAFPFGQVGGE